MMRALAACLGRQQAEIPSGCGSSSRGNTCIVDVYGLDEEYHGTHGHEAPIDAPQQLLLLFIGQQRARIRALRIEMSFVDGDMLLLLFLVARGT